MWGRNSTADAEVRRVTAFTKARSHPWSCTLIFSDGKPGHEFFSVDMVAAELRELARIIGEALAAAGEDTTVPVEFVAVRK
jgi:hypothetical protein